MFPATTFHAVHGQVVVRTYAPDGDSVRFAPHAPSFNRGETDAAVLEQLRLVGIDAPELHYRGCAQPFGARSRDALVRMLGVEHVRYADNGTIAVHGARVSAVVLTRKHDRHGRPLAYLVGAHDTAHVPHGEHVTVESDLLVHTVNARMLRTGNAYPLLYASLPEVHRTRLRAWAAMARRRRLGLWAHDVTTRGFSIADVHTAHVMPKLFRRVVDWRAEARDMRFERFLQCNADERVQVGGHDTHFSAVVAQHGDRVKLEVDPLDLTFLDTAKKGG